MLYPADEAISEDRKVCRKVLLMIANLLNTELKAIYSFLKRNYRELVVLGSATLFLILSNYHPVWHRWFSADLYYAIMPVLSILILLRKNPLDFGLRLGNPRIWGLHVGVTCLIALPIVYLASRDASFQAFYTIAEFSPLVYFLETAAYLLAWEFIFRGFLLFGLKERLVELSILVQMVPFVLLHINKPEIETMSTIMMGVYLGYIAYRGNSYWPAFIIHLFVNISLVFFINL
ncbi:lysostaphin resistance A-like protein [Chloroflexota bacterium]